MGMYITTASSDLLTRECVDITQNAQSKPVMARDVLKEMGFDKPVKVDISEEGLAAYKKMYQNNDAGKPIKSMEIRLTEDGMVFGHKDWPDMKDFVNLNGTYHKAIKEGLTQDWYSDWTSVKDKASILVTAYARAYDEIVKGYENGTRVKYKADMEAENLYRPVTKEEELADLEKSYTDWVKSLERDNAMACRDRRDNAQMFIEWSNWDPQVSKKEARRAYDRYLELKDEEKIGDIMPQMMEAINRFHSQYEKFGLNNFSVQVF